MDPSGRITGVAMRDKGAIEDSRNKVLSVFDWKVKGVEAVVKTGTSGRIEGNVGRRTWWESKMTDTRRLRSSCDRKTSWLSFN